MTKRKDANAKTTEDIGRSSILDTQEFDEICYAYRMAKVVNPPEVVNMFEELKTWIKEHFIEIPEPIEKTARVMLRVPEGTKNPTKKETLECFEGVEGQIIEAFQNTERLGDGLITGIKVVVDYKKRSLEQRIKELEEERFTKNFEALKQLNKQLIELEQRNKELTELLRECLPTISYTADICDKVAELEKKIRKAVSDG